MSSEIERSILPIPDRVQPGLTTFDAKDPDTKFPPIRQVRPPAGAPNVLVVLLDDVGFGAASTFGGPCETPVAERLASGGLRYNRFHTTALCAPTRAALLTGRNHHSVGMGNITELATSAPGYTSVRPNNKAPLAETLKLNGYSTAQFGKCHEVAQFQNAPMIGPFDTWPTFSGFEYYYGFIGAEDNQWYPTLTENTTPVEPPKTPEEGYHLTEDLADHAINYIRTQKSLVPDKPFFIYFAPGATHAPHHVPPEWIERYKGKFAHGWDRQREITFARQKELGVIPPDAGLTERPEGLPAWDETDEKLKPVLERQMETCRVPVTRRPPHRAGHRLDRRARPARGHADLLHHRRQRRLAGGHAEGHLQRVHPAQRAGRCNRNARVPGGADRQVGHAGGLQPLRSAVGLGDGHAVSMDQAGRLALGGTRNGTIVHWPNGIKDNGGLRSQFCHVIDIAPTVLEVAGIPEPSTVNGVTQSPYEGTSMVYSFNALAEPERHDLQYFEMMGNRGIYHKGWSAVTCHRKPWLIAAGVKMVAFDDDKWELYDGSTDYSQARDLATEMPAKLRELQRLWLIEATKYNVLPMDDRTVERFNPELAGRPEYVTGTKQILYPGMTRLTESSLLNIKNKSFQVTAQVVVPDGGAHGTIIAQGGSYGGWGLMIHDGAARFAYNLLGVNVFLTDAERSVPAGEHQVRAEFAYDGGGLAKGGTVTLYYDGEKAGEGKIALTEPMLFTATETAEVGRELGTTVIPDTSPKETEFTGTIKWVELSVGEDDHSHMIDPDDIIHMLLAKQ